MNTTPHPPPPEAPGTFVLVDEAEWAEVRHQMRDILATVTRIAGAQPHLLAQLQEACPKVPRSHRYTPAEAAERLHVSRGTLDKLIGAPDGFGAVLMTHREGRTVFVTEGHIQDYEARLDLDAERRAAGRSRRRSPLGRKTTNQKASAVNETAEAPNAAR